MYRLLIVDNEEYVVNGLVELFHTEQHAHIEAIGAYSAAEALNILMTTHMDIVITDIRMPRMNGLELQGAIKNRWPYCKVIFLSGYNDFDYAQEAMRQGAVNYILKTEEDEVIISSVYDAIAIIIEEKKAQMEVQHAKQAMKQAQTVLQKEYIESLCIGNKQAYAELETTIKELNIPLLTQKPLYMVVGKVDDWSNDYSKFDQSLMQYAIQNVANEYLALSMVHFAFIHERSLLVWFIQSKAESWIDHLEIAQTIKMTSSFVYGTFESIQSSCRELLQVSVSFAISPHAFAWQEIEVELDHLKWNVSSTLKKQQLVLAEQRIATSHSNKGKSLNSSELLQIYESLIYDLEHRNEARFREKFEEILPFAETAFLLKQKLAYTQLTSMLSAMLIEKLEELHHIQLPESIALFRSSLEDSLMLDWNDMLEHYSKIIDFLFEQLQPARDHEENKLVQSIHRYIEQNLGGDVSLKTMAYVMGHNPSYLSRLYKHKAGKQLSETINEMKLHYAKQLLEDPNHRISDVAKEVGFLSEHYFYRFFKKSTHMTPQEYRQQLKVKERQ